ncbi:MAG: efflux transporter outer membrane subunit [Rhodospirillaceae bacterium]|nr:efflux transporter outer membrane subunit [Rhodospirillaceae bacterium]
MKTNSWRRGLVPAVLIAMLSACSLVPDHERPAPPISSGPWAETVASGESSGVNLEWRDFVTDETLRGLIDQALAENRDLRQTLLDVDAARALYRVQRAERLPTIEAQGAGSRQRLPADLSSTGRAAVQSSYQAGLGLTAFELDLFGRVRSLSEAGLEDYLATEAAAQSARISLVSEVIGAYLVRDGAQRRLALIGRTLLSRESSLELISQRRRVGAATELDYLEAQGLVEQTRADMERTDREFRQAGNALRLLLGSDEPRLPEMPGPVRPLVQNLAAGTPSDLLTSRPDIRAAEHRLRARNANIGAARAAFFPRITLTGLFGTSSAELGDLFGSGQRAWSFAPQITLPIFDGGANRANLDLAETRKDIAVAAYEQTVQSAFREVSDALAATNTLRREEEARRARTETSARALYLAEQRYRAGLDDHLRYLDAQRDDFANQVALIETATERQIALATLFKTLGGGWVKDAGAKPQ